MRQRAGQAGFTAIEIMVVTLVVGIVLAAGIPSIRGLMQSNVLQSGADEFAGRLRLARQAAVAEGVPYIVDWDAQSQTYTVGRDENGDNLLQSAEIQSGPYSLASGLKLENAAGDGFTGSQVVFGPDGGANETGTVMIKDGDDATVELTVLGPTGQVRVD